MVFFNKKKKRIDGAQNYSHYFLEFKMVNISSAILSLRYLFKRGPKKEESFFQWFLRSKKMGASLKIEVASFSVRG